MKQPLLKIDDIDVFYGGIQALRNVSIEIEKENIVTILGANGAGKTTVLRTISGLLRPSKGSVSFSGMRIDRMAASKIVALGIAHVPENRGIFFTMDVADNLKIGHYARIDKKKLKIDYDRVYDYFPVLKERAKQLGGNLSGGEQQMLSIARAILLNPKLIMIDELSLGLAPIIVQNLFKSLQRLVQEGITILLVEQNARAALNIANRGYVLETGTVSLSGNAEELRGNDQVRKAYLVM